MLDARAAYDAPGTSYDARADRFGDAKNDGSAGDVCIPNGCGGCVVLSAEPGTACGQCGKYACSGAGGNVTCVDPGYVRVSAVAAGTGHICALTTAHARCWGFNNAGQLGDGTLVDRSTPPATDVLTGVQAIAAGGTTTCALTTGGGVRCWGDNSVGQLGDNEMESSRTTPPPTDVLTGVRVIAEGDQHTCAVTTAGGVRCWGFNAFGQLGDGVGLDAILSVPPATDLLTEVRSIAAGVGHTCALTMAGGVRCWGDNSFGQLGDGTTTTRGVTTPVADVLQDVQAIAVGAVFTCVVTTAGGVRCWGTTTMARSATARP
jgi:alpha-tubulin suppressor-like RCC1 family protein